MQGGSNICCYPLGGLFLDEKNKEAHPVLFFLCRLNRVCLTFFFFPLCFASFIRNLQVGLRLYHLSLV